MKINQHNCDTPITNDDIYRVGISPVLDSNSLKRRHRGTIIEGARKNLVNSNAKHAFLVHVRV